MRPPVCCCVWCWQNNMLPLLQSYRKPSFMIVQRRESKETLAAHISTSSVNGKTQVVLPSGLMVRHARPRPPPAHSLWEFPPRFPTYPFTRYTDTRSSTRLPYLLLPFRTWLRKRLPLPPPSPPPPLHHTTTRRATLRTPPPQSRHSCYYRATERLLFIHHSAILLHLHLHRPPATFRKPNPTIPHRAFT